MTTLTVSELKELQISLQSILADSQLPTEQVIEARSLYYPVSAYLHFVEKIAKIKMTVETARQADLMLQHYADKIAVHYPLPLAA